MVLENLSEDNYVDVRYYKRTHPGIQPRIHWCFVGEIVDDRNALLPRHYIKVRDKAGKDGMVAFYTTENPPNPTFRISDLKNGDTIFIKHAHKHQFLDGNIGIKLEDHLVGPHLVKVVPCNLATVLSLSGQWQSMRDTEKAMKCFYTRCSRSGTAATKLCT